MSDPSGEHLRDTSMKDKVCIVTGASSGIGLATTQHLLALGARVLGVDVSPLHASLQDQPAARFAFHQGNLAERETPAAAVRAAQAAFGGRIDALMNVAGVLDLFQSADTLDPAVWDRVIAVNLTAPVRLMGEVIKVMRAQGRGAIVNVTSKAGMSGSSVGVAYTSSKHGLVGATRATAVRFRREGIRCNAIAPGSVATNMTVADPNVDMAGLQMCMELTKSHFDPKAGKPLISPGEVANVMSFLASDASERINGAVLPVDEAWSCF